MEILRCLRLKVWDPEAKRMVSLSDMAKPIRRLESNLIPKSYGQALFARIATP